MPTDDAPNIRQADAGAFELIDPMQALKYSKQVVGVLHVKTGTVVADVDKGFFR